MIGIQEIKKREEQNIEDEEKHGEQKRRGGRKYDKDRNDTCSGDRRSGELGR